MNLYKEAQWASFDWEYYRHTAWVYSDLGSKRQQHDIEPMRKWTSQFGDPLDLWRRSEISYHQSRLFILF